MTDSYLQQLVIRRCRELGDQAPEFFGVGPGLIRQWINGSKSPSLAAVEKVFVLPDTPPEAANWNDREVFIAMPFYRTVDPRTLFSILGVWDREKYRAGLEFSNSVLVDAREQLADSYLKTDAKWCFWTDSDMIFPIGNAAWYNRYSESTLPEKFAGLHTPNRLRSHGKSIVSAVCFERRAKGRACYHEALLRTPEGDLENARAHEGPREELRPTAWAGLGCLMHNRQVLEDIQKTHPHLAPETPSEVFHFFSNASDGVMKALPSLKEKVEFAAQHVKGGSGEAALKALNDAVAEINSAVKENQRVARLRQGEDQTFGRRAAAAGHTTFVDHALHVGHIGERCHNAANTK